MFPALAYVGKTLASLKKRSGREPAAKPWVSCWFMSEAAMTSTLLPVLSSHGLAVSCWSLTSAGPFEVIMNFSVTGPLLADWVAPLPDPLSNPLPPPQAARARAPVRPAASAGVVGAGGYRGVGGRGGPVRRLDARRLGVGSSSRARGWGGGSTCMSHAMR